MNAVKSVAIASSIGLIVGALSDNALFEHYAIGSLLACLLIGALISLGFEKS